MTLQSDLPGLNYAVITGVIKRRKGINLTRSGLPVLHLLVENIVDSYPGSSKTIVSEIEVDVWGKNATSLDAKLQTGKAVLIEGILTHRKMEEKNGGIHFKTLLRARRVEFIV